MRRGDNVILIGLVLLACVSMLATCDDGARAQGTPEADDPSYSHADVDEVKADALALARVYRHENGYPHGRYSGRRRVGYELHDDMPAIDAVLDRVRAARERAGRDPSYGAAARAYVPAIERPRDGAADCETPFLTLDGAEPACWGHSVSWESRREGWLLIVRHAIDVRLGLVEHRCTAPPFQWGCGPAQTARGCRDHERAERAGWVEVDCGETMQTYYIEAT